MNRKWISVVILMSAVFCFPTGCARYRDLAAGTIKEIPGQGGTATPLQRAKAMKAMKNTTPIVEQEIITVPPLEEPPPSPDYRVGPNDILFFNVSGKPEFSSLTAAASVAPVFGAVHPPTGSRVDGSGNIQFPYFGTIKVGGMTLAEIQNLLRELMPKYVKDPWVVVEVGAYKSHPLYLLGQFRNPGTYYMDRPLNLLQGIAMGNGYDAAANLGSARLIRDKKIVPVDIHDLLTRGDQRQNIWLKAGDTIYLPDNKNLQVFVFGAVKKGGPVPMPTTGLTLTQAIASAELRDTGYDISHVRIIRSLSATHGELMVVDFDKVLRGEALSLPLKEGDIVFVPKSGLGSWNDAINEILPSLQTISALLQPFVSIKFLSQ